MIENLIGIKEIVDYNTTQGIRIYLNEEPENYPLHWHSATEIIIPIDSIYTIEVDDVKYIVNPKEILVIPSGQLHSLYAPPKGLRIIILFENSLLSNIQGINSVLYNLRPFVIINKKTFGESSDELISTIYEVIDEYFALKNFREVACLSLLMKFLVLLERNKTIYHLENSTVKKNNNYHECISRTCEYIDAHCTEALSLEELAQVAGYSPFHFSRIFKEYKNDTIYNYITRRRIMYAENLLMLPEMSITQVAINSGFESISTFNRVFKNIKKCTPTQFINMNKNYSN